MAAKRKAIPVPNPIPHSVFSHLSYPKTGGRLGNCYLLWGDELKHDYFPFICLVGPDWPTLLITFAFQIFVLFGDLYLLRLGLETSLTARMGTSSWIPVIVGAIICLFPISVLLLTTCSNPGIIYRGEPPCFTEFKSSVCSSLFWSV